MKKQTYRAVLDIEGIEFYSVGIEFLNKEEALDYFYSSSVIGIHIKELEVLDKGEWWVV